MFLLSQIGFVYMKLVSRNLRFWTSAKHLALITKTTERLFIWGGGSCIIRVKRLQCTRLCKGKYSLMYTNTGMNMDVSNVNTCSNTHTCICICTHLSLCCC